MNLKIKKMKKILLFALFVFFSFQILRAQSIHLVFPNGNEHFTEGVAAPHNIIWTASGISAFDVEYSTDSGSNWTSIATNITANFLNWAPSADYSDKCLIRVVENGGSVADTSDASFSIVPVHNYYAEWYTSMGEFRTVLRNDLTPITAQNFINLAERNFYDGLVFHRVISNFMIQDGDPNGDGTGGPGYEFDDEITPLLTHNAPGVLAMANAGPNTNGSQYYITVAKTSWLDGDYSIFGRVVDSMENVFAISKVATDANDHPLVDVVIDSIRIREFNPLLAMTYPTGSESFIEGTKVILTWESDFIADVKIEFSSDNGSNWQTIVDSIPADAGQYPWIIPSVFSNQCLIRLTDLDSNISSVTSPFEIRIKPVKMTRIEAYEGVSPNPENPENLLQIGEAFRFKVKLLNQISQDLNGITAELSSTDTNVIISNSTVTLTNLSQGQCLWAEGNFEIVVPDNFPSAGYLPLKVSVSSSNIDDIPWETEFILPMLKIGNFCVIDDDNNHNSQGNNNHIAEPDETIELKLNLANPSIDTCYQVYGRLAGASNLVNVWNNHSGTDGTVYDSVMYNDFNPLIPNGFYFQPSDYFVFDYTASDTYYLPLLLKAFGFIHGEEGADYQTGGIKMIWGVPYVLNSDYPLVNQEFSTIAAKIIVTNPVRENINFIFESKSDFLVELYDISGKKVLALNENNNVSNSYQINIGDLGSGLYLMRIVDKNSTYFAKIVKN